MIPASIKQLIGKSRGSIQVIVIIVCLQVAALFGVMLPRARRRAAEWQVIEWAEWLRVP